jgi:hypothetical protein
MLVFQRLRKLSVLAVLGLALALGMATYLPSQAQSTAEIEAVVLEVVRDGLRADLTPEIRRINVSGDYALATWNVEHMGGQTLLHQSEAGWVVVESGGGAMNAAVLEQWGVPSVDIPGLLEE